VKAASLLCQAAIEPIDVDGENLPPQA